jgi:hypothetical protein
MSKAKVTRPLSPAAMAAGAPVEGSAASRPYDLHPIGIALAKARAARMLLIILNDGDDYIQIPMNMTDAEEADLRRWLVDMAENALGEALDEAADALRLSLTPQQAREGLFPKAVA